MAEGRSDRPMMGTIKWILLVIVALYIFKIYLREPPLRYIEVCYLPHKVAAFFWVDVWGTVVPNDNVTLIKHSMDLKQFFFNCTATTKNWDFLQFGR
ncbi:hypothetical protein [Stutzerimonas stutzeri]|jgi:hypothetical protein|uniref:hypothetical protein n=1 Tax=Stutzerimonas stutzeri TaxID=316 RepID=UPI001BCB2A23|nr:hypothetical protein [Stutzerimonas stutzeri]